jgi:hypothetical protein
MYPASIFHLLSSILAYATAPAPEPRRHHAQTCATADGSGTGLLRYFRGQNNNPEISEAQTFASEVVDSNLYAIKENSGKVTSPACFSTRMENGELRMDLGRASIFQAGSHKSLRAKAIKRSG